MMAGGVFTAQNKLRAGAYIRFRSAGQASAQVGERGTAAIPLFLSFGESGKFIPIDGETDVEKRLGFPADHEALKLLRECGKRAKKVLVWRLSEGEKASATGGNLTVKAKYGGERGNALVVRVTAEEDGFSVETLLDGKVMDQQEGKTATDLSGNDWVDFSGSGALSAQAGLALTGGSDGEETAESYDKFFKALETADFETFALPTEDKSVIRKAVSFVKRMREEEGKKIQGVVASYPQADCEGILSVKNGVKLEDGTEVSAAEATAYVAGMTAGAQMNESNTYDFYDGASDVLVRYTGSEIETALRAGEWVFVPGKGGVVVEQDRNTLTSFTAEKGKIFSKNRPLRVMDGLAKDLKELFEGQYLGKTGNSADGRSLFKAEILGYLQELEQMGAIEDVEAEDVEVLPGNDADSVVVNLKLWPVDSMEKLYMTVEIR